MKYALIAAASLSILTFASVAVAQSPAMEEVAAACKADVARLCPGVTPGGGKIKECLMAQKREVSFGCKKALYQAHKAKEAQAAATAH